MPQQMQSSKIPQQVHEESEIPHKSKNPDIPQPENTKMQESRYTTANAKVQIYHSKCKSPEMPQLMHESRYTTADTRVQIYHTADARVQICHS